MIVNAHTTKSSACTFIGVRVACLSPERDYRGMSSTARITMHRCQLQVAKGVLKLGRLCVYGNCESISKCSCEVKNANAPQLRSKRDPVMP